MSTNVTIGPVRLSYPHLFEAKVIKGSPVGTQPKYSCALLIDKNDKKNIAIVEQAIEEAIAEGNDKLKNTNRKKWKMPLKDGDDEQDKPEYAGHFYINANNSRQPGIGKRQNKQVVDIIDEEEIYGGCYVYVNVNFFAFDNMSVGIGCSLQHVVKYKDGPRFDSRISTEAAFASVDFGDDDEEDNDENDKQAPAHKKQSQLTESSKKTTETVKKKKEAEPDDSDDDIWN